MIHKSQMFLLWSVIVLRIVLTEGRVLCQDINASPWKPLGQSCPVNCDNIRYAIERLKMLDYHSLLSKDVDIRENLSSSNQVFRSIEDEISRSYNTTEYSENNVKSGRKGYLVRKWSKYERVMYKEFKLLMHNKTLINELKTTLEPELGHTHKDKCLKLLKKASLKPNLLNQILKQCSRRSTSVEIEFLNTLTDILNKYSKIMKFNLDMTRILLQKILGSNMDLRNGIFDIKKILSYLKAAIENSDHKNHGLATLTLRSSHCLTVYVVGCFCKDGYVESSGRCVRPIHCIKDKGHDKYIARIFVH